MAGKSAKPSKYYVVWKGRQTGIFRTWKECETQVARFPGAEYKSFPTQAQADAAYAAGSRSKIRNTSSLAGAAPSSRKKTAPASGRGEETAVPDVEIYCDGACDPNPGKAGSGIAVYRKGVLEELWYGLYTPRGTNNSAELSALHQALLLAREEIAKGQVVRIRCDSRYSIQCITEWAAGWKRNGWKRPGDQEIQNLAIIQQAHALYEEIKSSVAITHVRGHKGIEGNELADRMAMYGADRKAEPFTRYPTPYTIREILALRPG